MAAARRKSDINFAYAPLSDETVVEWLLENRLSVTSKLECGNVNEDVIITYADLDRILDAVKLSAGQRQTIDLVMRGFAISDIVEYRGGQRQSYAVFYRRAIRKICQMCKDLWDEFYGGRPAEGFCYAVD